MIAKKIKPTIRGVSYEEKRDRWRCFHRRFGKPVLQLRFESQYEAVWGSRDFPL